MTFGKSPIRRMSHNSKFVKCLYLRVKAFLICVAKVFGDTSECANTGLFAPFLFVCRKTKDMNKASIIEAHGLKGLQSDSGNVLLPPLYKEITPCYTEIYLSDCYSFATYYIVLVNTNIGEKYALYDFNGQIVLPPIYNKISHAFSNCFIITPEWGCGVYEINKGEIIATEYEEVFVSIQYFVVSKNGKKGVFNSKGEIVCAIEYDDIKITEELILGKQYGNIVIYDSSGAVLFNHFYDEITDLVYGEWTDYYLVRRQNRWGCLNRSPWFCITKDDVSTLIELIPCMYDFIAYTDKTLYSCQNDRDMFIKFFVKKSSDGHLYFYQYDLYNKNDNPISRDKITTTTLITNTFSMRILNIFREK